MKLLDTFKALGDEGRLRIVHILSFGAFNVQELTSILELGQSTVSHHLKILQNAGLVKSQKEGTWAYYALPELSSDAPSLKIVKSFLTIINNEQSDELDSAFRSDEKAAREILATRRDDAHRYFESVAPKWKELRDEALGNVSFLHVLSEKLPKQGTMVELGCGSGALLEEIVPREGKTIGVDYSHAMLEEARQNLGARAEYVDLRLGYLEKLPLEDSSADIVVAYMVLHHLSHPLEALKDAFRVLKPDGNLFVIDLTKHQHEYMRERYADLWLGFDLKELEGWIKEAGFSATHIENLGKNGEALFLTATKPKKKSLLNGSLAKPLLGTKHIGLNA